MTCKKLYARIQEHDSQKLYSIIPEKLKPELFLAFFLVPSTLSVYILAFTSKPNRQHSAIYNTAFGCLVFPLAFIRKYFSYAMSFYIKIINVIWTMMNMFRLNWKHIIMHKHKYVSRCRAFFFLAVVAFSCMCDSQEKATQILSRKSNLHFSIYILLNMKIPWQR